LGIVGLNRPLAVSASIPLSILWYGLWRVLNTFQRQRDQLITIELEDGITVTATPDHPFYMASRAWKTAAELSADDVLFDQDNSGYLVVWSVVKSHEVCTVYNMEVEGLHNYFVTPDGVLTHNLGAGFNHYFMRSFQKVINLEHALGYGERILGAQRKMSARAHTRYHKDLYTFLKSKSMLPVPGYTSRDIFERYGEPKIIDAFRQFYREKCPEGKDLFERELKAFRSGAKIVN
jgi:hypothetical protein